MKLRLASRIVLIFGLFVAALLAVVGVLSYRSGSETLKAAVISEMRAVAIEKETVLDTWVEERLSGLGQLATDEDLVERADMLVTASPASGEEEAAHTLLLKELEPHLTGTRAGYIELFVIAPNGTVVASTGRGKEGKSKIGYPYFEQGRKAPYLQAPYQSSDLKAPAMTAAVPLLSSDGRLVAVLAARLDFAALTAIAQRWPGAHLSGDSFLINRAGFIVTQPRLVPDPLVLQRKIETEAARRCTAGKNGISLAVDYRGVPVISLYRWMARQNLGLLVQIDQTEALAPARTFGHSLVWISSLALLAAVGLAFLLARTITRRLRALHESVRNFAEGKVDKPLPESSDELGLVAREFNEMAARHQRAEAERQVISEVVQGVITTSNLEELLNLAHRSISKFLYAENCFVALHDPKTDLLHWNFWVDKVDSLPPPLPVGEGFSSYVLRTGQPLLLTAELKAQMYEQGKFTKSGSDSPSWLGVPLRTPSRTIGVLAVQHYEKENAYNQRDLEFLSSVGDQIALAIERKRAEEKLKGSEARLAEAQRVARVGSWEWNVITNEIIWSEEEYRLFGFAPNERAASYELYQSCVHPDVRKDALDWLNGVVANKKSSEIALRIVRPDGEERLLQNCADVVLDEIGIVVGVVGTSQDITEREKAERALAASEERTRLIVDTAHDAFIGMNSDGLINNWNPRAETTFGWSREEAVGQPMHELIIPPKFREMHVQGLKHFLATGEGPALNKLIEVSAIHRDGREMPIELMISPIRTGDSFIFSASLRDITERKRAEAELKQAKEIADAANQSKSEFLANMSHEIRTPMNGIIGMTDLTLETDLSRVQREYLGMVQSSAHSLLRLINDILDFSKIEAGHLQLESMDFSLRDCVGKTLETLGIRSSAKGLELAVRIDPQISDTLVGDAARLRQVITNLVDNAIKFTARGEIVVEINCESHDATEACLHFSICDTGTGIAKDKQDLIFEAFVQEDGSTTRHYGGTGLGLGICTKIVEQMGGKIWVESTPGAGSTFHFTAHFALSKTPARSSEDREIVHGLRVLVVDDNATNRRIFHEMLLNWGMIPLLTTSAQEAVAEVELATNAGWSFDLVLVDAMMPETDGFSLAKQLRSAPGTVSTPIIMLSSGARPGDNALAQSAGISILLTKPVQQSVLLDAIQNVIEEKPGRSATVQAAPETLPISKPVVRALRVLVADDNVVNRAVAAGILGKLGHSIVHAANGREALQAFKDASFDLVFMDVQMPEMDGFEATRGIREIEQSNRHRTPIVAMTAHAMAGDRERCLAGGMDDYIAKPIRKEELIRVLENCSHAAKTRVADAPAESLSHESKSESAPSVCTREELLEQCEGDEELLDKLISLFNENTPQILDAIRESIDQRDAPALARGAHKLLSSTGAFGAERARALAVRLEEQGERVEFDGAKERFADLEREINKIHAALTDCATIAA